MVGRQAAKRLVQQSFLAPLGHERAWTGIEVHHRLDFGVDLAIAGQLAQAPAQHVPRDAEQVGAKSRVDAITASDRTHEGFLDQFLGAVTDHAAEEADDRVVVALEQASTGLKIAPAPLREQLLVIQAKTIANPRLAGNLRKLDRGGAIGQNTRRTEFRVETRETSIDAQTDPTDSALTTDGHDSMTQRDNDTTDADDTTDLEVDGGETSGLGRMLLDIAESESADFEHERISTSIRQKLFKLGSAPHIGPYAVTKQIGAGGMGEVYECRDQQLDRKVAVKLVRGSGGEHDQERLLREAKAMAKLAHPNVVTVFEVGRHGGRTFIVMEYIRGQTLARWLGSGPTWRAVLERFVAAGRGLAAAHRAGLVHRDFKPDNVLLGRDGSVKVADFGLALTQRQVASRRATSSPGTGAAAGTTRYMPPEQLLGEAVDARSDQFAFCSALYEGLWRELPFVGTTRDHPKPPRRSHGLWSIVRRGLAPDPNERWPDMEALLGALERVPKRARRIGWLLTGTLAGACLAVVAVEPRADACAAVARELDGVWDEPRRAELEQHLATLEFSQASHVQDSTQRVLASLDAWSSSWLTEREQACRDHEARLGERAAILSREHCLDHQREQVQLLVDALDHADGATLAQGVVVLDEFPDPSACADSTFSPLEAPPLAQSLRIKRIRSELDHATQLRRLGQLGRAHELARVVDAAARTLDYGPVQAEARAELAKAEDVAGAPEQSAVLYDQAIDLAEIHHHDRLSAQLWIERAELSLFDLHDPKHPEQGEQWLHRAEVAQARVGPPDVQTQARFAFGRARVAENGKQVEVAKAGYAEALRLAREIESGDVPTYSNNLARVLARVVDSRDESLALLREAVEFAEAHWGARHPRTAESLFNLGLALDAAGLGGEQELETAAEIWIEVHDHAHPMLGNAYLVLARAALRCGDLELAEDHARTAAAIQAKVLPASDPRRGDPHELLAVVEGVRGHHEFALAHASVARAWFELASPGDPGALRMRREAANQLIALGRLDDATHELDHVLQQTGDDPVEEQQTRVLLAELALRAGRLDDADLQLRAVEALGPNLRSFALTYEVLRTLIDHRRGRLDPAQLERLHRARARSPFTDQQLVAWFDELELPPDERRLLE